MGKTLSLLPGCATATTCDRIPHAEFCRTHSEVHGAKTKTFCNLLSSHLLSSQTCFFFSYMEGVTNYICTALSQGLLVINQGWPGSSSSDLSIRSPSPSQGRGTFSDSLRHTSLVSTDMDVRVNPTSLSLSLQSGPIQGIHGGSGTPYTENLLPQV